MRQGFCTAGCGACCRFLRLQVAPDYYANADVRRWIELHGIGVHVGPQGSVWAHIPIPCTALTPEGLCGLIGSPERPKMCGEWPFSAADLIGFEQVCTYSFATAREKADGGECHEISAGLP